MKRSLVVVALAACAHSALAFQSATTARLSLSTNGTEGNAPSIDAALSADGRFVAFTSSASNLVAGDTNLVEDIFVREIATGLTERVSLSSAGLQSNGFSNLPALSTDGRFIAFRSDATNLVAGDTNGTNDIFVRDRQLGTTERVSLSSSGAQSNGGSAGPSISADGRYVSFGSVATNLVAGDTNATTDVFVRDRLAGLTWRASVDSSGGQGNGSSAVSSISATGRFVAFHSGASNLVPGDANGVFDCFVHDNLSGATEIVSVDSNGLQGNFESTLPRISADGRWVVFTSEAKFLVPGDQNGVRDVFVHDRASGQTLRASVDSLGTEALDASDRPAISPGGRFVAFESRAANLVGNDGNGLADIFVHDLVTGSTLRASVDTFGTEANALSAGIPCFSADGARLVFQSQASNLVASDTNGSDDVFLREQDLTNFESLCEPGVAGVMACPCANPPAGAERGCDNSSATGGARLAASGATYLGSDSLIFTTSGEKPSATSVVMQGNSLVASGTGFGQGVRCAGGILKRLYVKSAAAGSIRAPDFGAGDAPVSTRSAQLGDPILPGQSRWYLVYYRDPQVLGGCPVIQTFNATQTGRVDWQL